MMSVERLRLCLEEIARASGGILIPQKIVEVASNPVHPLHDRFQWNDEVAAHAHRIDQARALIRSVRVNVTNEKKTIETVFYVRDPRSDSFSAGYTSLPRLRSDKELAREAVEQEIARAEASLRRASEVASGVLLPSVSAEIEDLIRRLRRIAMSVPVIEEAM